MKKRILTLLYTIDNNNCNKTKTKLEIIMLPENPQVYEIVGNKKKEIKK